MIRNHGKSRILMLRRRAALAAARRRRKQLLSEKYRRRLAGTHRPIPRMRGKRSMAGRRRQLQSLIRSRRRRAMQYRNRVRAGIRPVGAPHAVSAPMPAPAPETQQYPASVPDSGFTPNETFHTEQMASIPEETWVPEAPAAEGGRRETPPESDSTAGTTETTTLWQTIEQRFPPGYTIPDPAFLYIFRKKSTDSGG